MGSTSAATTITEGDRRPNRTGGLSGATRRGRGWGKIRPEMLPDRGVCYLTPRAIRSSGDAFDNHPPRTPKRLYDRRDEMMQRIRDEYEKSERNEATQASARDHAAHSGHMLERDR